MREGEGEGSREEKGEKRMHQRTGDDTSKNLF